MIDRKFPVPVLVSTVLAVWACVILSACSKPPVEKNASSGYEATLLQERAQKDASFKFGPQSPLPDTAKASFKGLSYYPPNPDLRFRVQLTRYRVPQMIRIGTNTGEVRTGLRYGYFDFQVEGKSCRLQVYRMDDTLAEGGAYLFIPFKDKTSGAETYVPGRYIDLQENTSGWYDLDFNRATNPYCAYGKGYSCPVPPEENKLAVPIRAGEKTYEHP